MVMEGLKTTEQLGFNQRLTEEERIRLFYGVSEEKPVKWTTTEEEEKRNRSIRKCLTEN